MEGRGKQAELKKEKPASRSLIDLVFSWSIEEVLNKDLYKNQVKRIPETFLSTADYMRSLIPPLLEEIHADLSSSMKSVPKAPVREVLRFSKSKNYRDPGDLFYTIPLKPMDTINGPRTYKPEAGDLLAVSDVRPESESDLNRPRRPYLVAYIMGLENGNPDILKVLASKPILVDENMKSRGDQSSSRPMGKQTRDTLFVVFLTNLTTNIRIWRSLKSELDGGNMKIISRVLQGDPNGGEHCSHCSLESNRLAANNQLQSIKGSSALNPSQREAIISCLCMRQCLHQNSVKLIWGPPGTGKTKTVGLLLFLLLKLKCRTLTCAPTNIAVLAVTSRVVGLFKESMKNGTYGVGDIVLFGNGERMKIDEKDDLLDVFLDYRVDVLCTCFNASTGWKQSIESMISLLDDPDPKQIYCQRCISEEKKENKEENIDVQDITESINCFCLKDIFQVLIGSKSNEKQKPSASGQELQTIEKEDVKRNCLNKENKGQKTDERLTFEMFLKQQFKILSERLEFCIVNLSTHLPTSIISLEVVKNMYRALDLLKSLSTSLCSPSVSDEYLKQAFYGLERDGNNISSVSLMRTNIRACLHILQSLPRVFRVPNIGDKYVFRNFCLQEARLIFCTASSSVKLHEEGMTPVQLLVIDEAAQLKECESTIPLQLSGLHHAILVGDERQLPSMVQSKISEGAEFGRSLFERLTLLGHKKHLLNMQYRMHPSISLFPNKEFYAMQIQDAPSVQGNNYQKKFLQGNLYGPYSFINIAHGEEQFNDGHSCRNMVEAALVSDIVARLYKEFITTRKKMSIGVISPYKAQVHAIEQKIDKLNIAEGNFSVSVRSVDGFQGGEEDVIIMSTVRCNGRGSVGFLANLQRTNVSLTRARYCLWILGSGATLINSDSIWKKLVIDAKNRACFYNADEDKSLAKAIMIATAVELDDLLNMKSLQVGKSIWKVCFSDDFQQSLAGIVCADIQEEVICFLRKLSTGWRQPCSDRSIALLEATCSELLECYRVNDLLYLIWSVDTIKEKSNYIQVLKVWDVLPRDGIRKLSKRLDSIFQKYTVENMNRCKHKLIEGDRVLPVRWPIDSSDIPEKIHCVVDGLQHFSQRFASLSIRDQSQESTPSSSRSRSSFKPQERKPKRYTMDELIRLKNCAPTMSGKGHCSIKVDGDFMSNLYVLNLFGSSFTKKW
ncbi:hypothetical protein K2173_017955 [Erythroxylum novogranatense]|uniref:Helicase MAGATAMA 3 n=1 Tax=Erythroxylum novogranatense TaxID=1862640 RepID=A0AAV8TWP9_9ROSI|nr:hypothetical protein K2173_017955 [Erythroxylum novogranatense]